MNFADDIHNDREYRFPPESLLRHYRAYSTDNENQDFEADLQRITTVLDRYWTHWELDDIQIGPTFTVYEIFFPIWPGKKLLSMLDEHFASALVVDDVRILQDSGRRKIRIEVPNRCRDTIGFYEMLPALKEKHRRIPMVLGRTVSGEDVVIDVAETPHLLISGISGSGKTMCLRNLICSMLYTKRPDEVEMDIVDLVSGSSTFPEGIPHLRHPVIKNLELAWEAMDTLCDEMDRRCGLFNSNRSKSIEDFNSRTTAGGAACSRLPYIVFIIDGFEEMILLDGKRFKELARRITAVGRFCGIHLVLTTKYPSSKIITGIIRSTFPTWIAFEVPDVWNSIAGIGKPGAEKLMGRGDMLYCNPAIWEPLRLQGPFIGQELEEIASFLRKSSQSDERACQTENGGNLDCRKS